MSSIDTTQPDGPWEFDANVAEVFDNMLERSIPQYHVMRNAVTSLALDAHNEAALREARIGSSGSGLTIMDLGASLGGAISPIIDVLGAQARYVAVERSEPMVKGLRERLAGWIDNKQLEVLQRDLVRDGVPGRNCSVILSVLTLQFTPIEYRRQLLRQIKQLLVKGGAFILVEKVIGKNAHFDDQWTKTYHEMKEANGYTPADILAKREALRGVLVPQTAHENQQMLGDAGFKHECFWRWMNFAGWLAINP